MYECVFEKAIRMIPLISLSLSTAHPMPRASMLDIPFGSRHQGEMKKELFIDGVLELLLLRLLAQNEMYGQHESLRHLDPNN